MKEGKLKYFGEQVVLKKYTLKELCTKQLGFSVTIVKLKN